MNSSMLNGWYPENCYYCERRMKMPDPIRKDPLFRTRDHVVPQSKGGKNGKANIVYCCAQCNFHKGSKSLWQWYCFLQSRAVVKFKTEAKWKTLIPTIIKNIQRHPLYRPEVDIACFGTSDRTGKIALVCPTTPAVVIEGEFDRYNFHEDYAANK